MKFFANQTALAVLMGSQHLHAVNATLIHASVYQLTELDAIKELDILNYDPEKVDPALQIEWEQFDLKF